MAIELKELLLRAVKMGASDIHLAVGHVPMYRVRTLIQLANDLPPLSADDTVRFLKAMVSERRLAELHENRGIDFSAQLDNEARFRVNAHYQRNTIALCFRVVIEKVPTLAELNLPPVVSTFADLPKGLVLITGPTGSGKSTTLASIVEAINVNHPYHIVIIEDPIERLFQSKMSFIEQRELGRDVRTFAEGLRNALRQDPDVIMLGEMRDAETTMAAITAAETGHLVLSSMHTSSPHQTIERIIDIYPGEQQALVRTTLANILHAVVSQTLFKCSDGDELIPACGIMICNTAVRNCIRDDRVHEIPNIIQTCKDNGMCTVEDAIVNLYRKGRITRAEAMAHVTLFPRLSMALSA
jgi:twitching motility protein PilT